MMNTLIALLIFIGAILLITGIILLIKVYKYGFNDFMAVVISIVTFIGGVALILIPLRFVLIK